MGGDDAPPDSERTVVSTVCARADEVDERFCEVLLIDTPREVFVRRPPVPESEFDRVATDSLAGLSNNCVGEA